jgi:pyridoxamine 5'-phosphate oxidase
MTGNIYLLSSNCIAYKAMHLKYIKDKNMKEYIKFANENPICHLATAEGDQPHVRALGFFFADETGFYFQTAAMKDFYHQLKKNPKTEVCFFTPGNMKMMRVEGNVEFINDIKLKERVLEERPFLKKFGMTSASDRLIIFRIAHGKAHFWTMEENLNPKKFLEF